MIHIIYPTALWKTSNNFARCYDFLISYHGSNKTIMTYERNLSWILLWECKFYSSNISCDIAKQETMWKISESNDINEVLKTYVMMLNDYVYESISNIASLKIINSS
jgi:hypothetical protein